MKREEVVNLIDPNLSCAYSLSLQAELGVRLRLVSQSLCAALDCGLQADEDGLCADEDGIHMHSTTYINSGERGV